MRHLVLVCVAALAALTGCWSKGTYEEKKEAAAVRPKSADTAGTPKVRPECVDIKRAFESALAPLDSEQPLENLAAIRKAAEEAGEDPVGCVRDRIDTMLKREREKLVWLTVAGARVPQAIGIYTCPKLDEKFVCRGAVADDTAHSFEAPITPVSRKAGDAVQIQLRNGYRPGSVRVFQILTHEGEPLPVERAAADGTLKLDDFIDGHRIFFALVQEPGGYVKYVWMVKTSGI